MIKVVGMARRRAGMSRAEFRDYWLNKHSVLERESLRTNPIRRIVANFVEDDLVGETEFDGMVELYYDTVEDMRTQWTNGHDEVMRADEANFCEPGFRVFFIAEEVEIGRKPD